MTIYPVDGGFYVRLTPIDFFWRPVWAVQWATEATLDSSHILNPDRQNHAAADKGNAALRGL